MMLPSSTVFAVTLLITGRGSFNLAAALSSTLPVLSRIMNDLLFLIQATPFVSSISITIVSGNSLFIVALFIYGNSFESN